MGHLTRYRETMADDLLFQFLRDHDAECSVCGYELRGLTTRVCPECGAEIELGVRATDPRLRIWIAGLITVSLPMGFFVIFLAFIGIALLVGVGAPPIGECWPMIAGVVVGAASIALLLVFRRRFRMLAKHTRFAIVGILNLAMVGLVSYQAWLIM